MLSCFKFRWVRLIIIAMITVSVTCYLDLRSPIVFMSNGKEDFFGYSLAFKKGPWREYTHPSGGTLFIGAPKETRFTKNSGVVWQCRFSPILDRLSCSLLSSVSEQPGYKDNACLHYDSQYKNPEKETDQMIGFSLSIQNNSLFVGAPRWKISRWYNQNNHHCSSETLLIGAIYQVSSRLTQTTQKLFNPNERNFKYWIRSVGSVKDKTISSWILDSTFGFTMHAPSLSDRILVGSPGHYKVPGEIREFPGYPHFSVYSGTSPSFGYAITSGRTVYGNYKAIGAPRGNAENLYGIVTIMLQNEKNPQDHNYPASYHGEQVGSYFGYALATVDMNGDGYDELIVGSPGLVQNHKSFGCVLAYDGARIANNVVSQKVCVETKISGLSNWALARFGSAICNMGDINADNLQDFAVSAPYADDGVGAVYIFHGSKSIIPTKPAQEIRGKMLQIPNLQGFGTFLLGGENVDVDGNGTPDLVVGAAESSQVDVLRTRPIAIAKLKLTFHTNENENGGKQIRSLVPDQKEFLVKVCVGVRYSVQIPANLNVTLDAWISIQTDPTHKRVMFKDTNTQTIIFREALFANNVTCFSKNVLTNESIEQEISDKPLTFQAALRYNQTKNVFDVHGNVIGNQTMLNLLTPNKQDLSNVFGDFKPYLPAPVPLTRSSLAMLEIKPDNCQSDGNPTCDSDLRFSSSPTIINTGRSTVGLLKSVTISAKVINHKETAYNVIFRVNWTISENLEIAQDLPSFVWREISRGNKSTCKLEEDRGQQTITSRIVRCTKPIHNNTEVQIQLEIGGLLHLKVRKPGIQGKGIIQVSLEVFPEMHEKTEKLVPKLNPVILKDSVKIDLTALKGIKTKVDPKMTALIDFSQIYRLTNMGHSGTSKNAVRVEVLIPKGIQIADPSTNAIHCSSENFQFFQLARHEMNTTKATMNQTIKNVNIQVINKLITFPNCLDGNKNVCQKLECVTDLPGTNANVSRELEILMYIETQTIQKFIAQNTVGIRLHSSVTVYFSTHLIQKVQAVTQKDFQIASSVPIWYYFAAGAGGILLLVLVTIGLFKCGFFERKARQKLKVLIRQSQLIDMNTLMALNANDPDVVEGTTDNTDAGENATEVES